jgi:hypothetical protein
MASINVKIENLIKIDSQYFYSKDIEIGSGVKDSHIFNETRINYLRTGFNNVYLHVSLC